MEGLCIVNFQPTLALLAVLKGGALPTMTALTAQGMKIMHVFVSQVDTC